MRLRSPPEQPQTPPPPKQRGFPQEPAGAFAGGVVGVGDGVLIEGNDEPTGEGVEPELELDDELALSVVGGVFFFFFVVDAPSSEVASGARQPTHAEAIAMAITLATVDFLCTRSDAASGVPRPPV